MIRPSESDHKPPAVGAIYTNGRIFIHGDDAELWATNLFGDDPAGAPRCDDCDRESPEWSVNRGWLCEYCYGCRYGHDIAGPAPAGE